MKKLTIIICVTLLLGIAGCFEEQNFEFPSEFSYVAFETSTLSIQEGTVSSVEVKVVYSGYPLSADLSIPVSISSSGSMPAQDGVDYNLSGSTGTLTIPAGAASTSFLVNIIDNDIAVGSRSLLFAIGQVQGFSVGQLGTDEGASLEIIIGEDDLFTFGYTSFEEPTAGDINNFASQDGVEQNNVPGENNVDYISQGGEMGFNTSYVPGQEGGADSGLLFGVTKFTADVEWEYDIGAFADGDQAYSTSDADGLMEIVFDEIDIPQETSLLQVEFMVHFITSSWETDDEFDFFWRTADGDELILSLRANENAQMTDSPDGSGNVIDDQWIRFVSQVSNIKTGSLVIQIGSDSGSEVNFFDSIFIRGL